MIRTLTGIALAMSLPLCTVFPAQADEDEIVRLPTSGEVRSREVRDRVKADRLKPAGGLFVSFDTDNSGTISRAEIAIGIRKAFTAADANGDGELTALEQQAWASGLPTRDDTLANPVRFDPNLDRIVSLDEFTTVIQSIGGDYADEVTGDIVVASLKALEPERRRGLGLPGLSRPDRSGS